VLKGTDKLYVKQAVCRMIIKFFGKLKNKEEGGDTEADAKIEFLTVIDPLV